MSDQFIRKVSLVVVPPTGDQGLDLSDMHFTFEVKQSDLQSPNHARIRVFNLKDDTSLKIENEYDSVLLGAGYRDTGGGRLPIIFKGTIKQIRRGKLNATDKYLDLLCADADLAYNFAVTAISMDASNTGPGGQYRALLQALNEHGVTAGYNPPLVGPVLPRGKALYGMARDGLRDLTDGLGLSWSIQNGQVQLLPLTGYLPGEAVVLNSATGMIGIPEQTENGIRVRTLLNPLLRVGGLVKINNTDINRFTVRDSPAPHDRFTGIQLPAPVTTDGFYRLYVVEHQGDVRGNDWYSDLTCLAVDITAPPDQAVKRFG